MNPIAQEATVALSKAGYPTTNNLCQKFARLVVEKVLGGKPMGSPNPLSATAAAHKLLAEGKAFPASDLARHGGLQAGDLLYKTQGSGGFGHVGIYIGDGKVVENSTVHWKRSGGKDARGVRSLKEFGAFQIVARFKVEEKVVATPVAKPSPPAIVKQKRLVLNSKNFPAGKSKKVGDEYWIALGALRDVGFVVQQQASSTSEHDDWSVYPKP